MSNIAEGFESQTQALFINYLGQARASAGEVRSQLYVAMDLEYISGESFNQMLKQAKKTSGQIYKFISYLQSIPNTRRISDNKIFYELPE
jgi:four helix bundle protein